MSARYYAAERQAFGKHLVAGITLTAAQELGRRYAPKVPIERGRSDGYASMFKHPWLGKDPHGRIRIGHKAGLCVVLHELAHARTFRTSPNGHGVDFQVEHLRLVSIEMSPWWTRRLGVAIRRHKPAGWKGATSEAIRLGILTGRPPA